MLTCQLSRRDWLARAVALGMLTFTRPTDLLGVPVGPQFPASDRLVPNPLGGYWFLPALPFLSFAVLADEGFEIVRATFRRPLSVSEGFAAIESHLQRLGRPLHALCGLELRSGRQSTPQEFGAFNAPYVERMREAKLLVGDRVPITRTNVAAVGEGDAHRIFAFSYTVPELGSVSKRAPTFILAAVPEVRNIGIQPEVVALGDTSLAGLREKIVFILDALESNLRALGVGWSDATGVQLYTLYDLHPLWHSVIFPRLGDAGRRGIQWYHAQPPVIGGEIEVDVRSTRMELWID